MSFAFAIGVLLSTIPANLLLMAKPLDGKPPVKLRTIGRRRSVGTRPASSAAQSGALARVANFVASGAHLVGPAVSYSIGQGATMVSACWGIFVWHEFSGAPPAAKRLLV